jgi:hypothetical protein
MSLIAIQADATLNGTQHIAGELNVICDKLSCDKKFSHQSLHAHARVSNSHICKVTALLSLCDPTSKVESAAQHLQFLQQILQLLA